MVRYQLSIKGHILYKIAPAAFQKFTVVGKQPQRFGLFLNATKLPCKGQKVGRQKRVFLSFG